MAVEGGPSPQAGPRQPLLGRHAFGGVRHRGHRDQAAAVGWAPPTVLLRATSDEGRVTVLSADSERATGHESRDTGDHPPITPIDTDYRKMWKQGISVPPATE